VEKQVETGPPEHDLPRIRAGVAASRNRRCFYEDRGPISQYTGEGFLFYLLNPVVLFAINFVYCIYIFLKQKQVINKDKE